MSDLEKLGAFYLGRRYDVEAKASSDEPLLYDAKDLTTHGLVVGMTERVYFLSHWKTSSVYPSGSLKPKARTLTLVLSLGGFGTSTPCFFK